MSQLHTARGTRNAEHGTRNTERGTLNAELLINYETIRHPRYGTWEMGIFT